MKITNQKLIASIASLQELISKEIPLKVAFTVAQNTGKIQDSIDAFIMTENAIKNKVTNIGESEGKQEFTKNRNELLELETEINITKIKLSDLGDIKIKPFVLINLDFMIE